MILRIYRARLPVSARDTLVNHIRDEAYPTLARSRAARSFQSGLREVGDGRLEFALATTWVDFPALLAEMGSDLTDPPWLHGIRQHLEFIAADHYEVVGAELRGLIPLTGGVLRIVGGELKAHSDSVYFDQAREAQQRLLDSGVIIATHIGRRVTGAQTEAIVVGVWRDRQALTEGDGPSGAGLLEEWQESFAAWEITDYDALVQVPPRDRAAPALLLADDDRHYVFATPTAASLLGTSVARLLGSRIEDVTPPELRDELPARWHDFLAVGRQEGPVKLFRRDGSVVEVRYSARAGTPWPGVHASLLTHPSEEIDVTEALAASGLVGHYSPPDESEPPVEAGA